MNIFYYVAVLCVALSVSGTIQPMGHSAENAGILSRLSLATLERTAPTLLMGLRTNEPMQLLANSASYSIQRTAKPHSLSWVWNVRH